VKNPILLVPRGERAALELEGGVIAHVVRGARPGPTVWAWAPRGEHDPSLQQALGELRDQVEPAELSGALGLLLEGPPPPLAGEQHVLPRLCRAISADAAAVVLSMGLPPGYQAMPHVALDVHDQRARRVGRALGARFLVPPIVSPRLHRGLITAPAVMWVDGESERLSREVIDRAVQAMRALLSRLGMLDAPTLRRGRSMTIVLKRVAEVAAAPGVVEPVVGPGDLVHAGQTVAFAGEPGLGTRRASKTRSSGVVLFVRSGRLLGGAAVGVGRMSRSLERVRADRADARRELAAELDVGWCERVALPELGVTRLKAKIDTGARTSALHVARMTPLGPRGEAGRLEIELPTGKAARARTVTTVVDVIEHTTVRDSGGHAERRPVIETTLKLGPIERQVRVTLTDRGDMLFPMLVGRTALPSEVRVLPSRRWLLG
jgi:hypothetical protein